MTDAKDMIDILRRHYLPESKPAGGVFAPEIQSPRTARRADLIWAGCTAASGYELVGHEVKISRSDLLVELADPAKSDPWQRYCDRWWLVLSDPAFVDGLDIPASWGIMAPPSGRRTRSMTVVRPAPALKPAEQAPAYKTIMTWQHWRLSGIVDAKQRLTVDYRRERESNDQLRTQIDRNDRRESPMVRVVDEIVRALGGVESGEIGRWPNVTEVDDVVAALKDLAVLRHRQRKAEAAIKSIRDYAGYIQQNVDALRNAGVAA